MFTDQWVDLKSRHVGITLVSDSDTEQGGFVLEYMTVPVVDDSVPSDVNAFFNYIQEQVRILTSDWPVADDNSDRVFQMLKKISENPLNTPEMIELQEQKVKKTIARLHQASKKSCFFLKGI